MHEPTKRTVPTIFRKILQCDVAMTGEFCLAVNQFLPTRYYRKYYKALEISCHGVPWLAGWLAFVWIVNTPKMYQMQVNFYLGLILDIFLVAVLKAIVRRRRPLGNTPDMFATFGPDALSFPSGHASRATFIVHFFTCLYVLPTWTWLPLILWAASICVSRVLLQRHHLLDVVAGVFLGISEGYVVHALWLGKDASHSLLSWLSDDSSESINYNA